MANMEGFVHLANGAKCIQCDNSDASKFRRYYDGDELLGAFCVKCEWEYLKEALLVSPSQENCLYLGKENFYKKTVAIDTTDSSVHMVHPTRTEITNLSLCADYLKPGDHIAWKRPYVIWHHALVTAVDTERNKVRVIHWSSQKGETAQITEELIDLKKERGKLYRMDYSEEVIKENPPRLVLARARSRLGDKGYDLFRDNCESFAAFCKKGVERSQQVRWLRKGMVDQLKKALGSLTGKSLELLKASFFPQTVKVSTAEAVEKVANNQQWIGFGLVVVIEGVITIIDIKKLYGERKDGNLTRKVFIEEVTKRVTEAILAGGLAAAGGLVAGPLGIFVGIIGGTCGKLVGSWLGPSIGRAITKFIKTDDKAVKDITELQTGDHIVSYRHFAHPRHHCIVLWHDGISKVNVIHNTFHDGVKQEWIDFVDPVYKVIYDEKDCHSDDEVLARAVSKLGESSYDLITYNCKHFAAWCKKR